MYLALADGGVTGASGYGCCLPGNALSGGAELRMAGYSVKLSLLVVLAGIGLLY